MFVGCRSADIFLSLHSGEAISEKEMGAFKRTQRQRTRTRTRTHARMQACTRIHTHTRTHYGLALLPGEFLRNEQRLLVGRRAVRPWLLVEARQQRGPERPVRKQGGSNNEPQSDDCVLHNDVCPCPRARQRARQRARHQLTRWPVQWTCLQLLRIDWSQFVDGNRFLMRLQY